MSTTAKPATALPYLLAYVALLALAGVSLIFARVVHWQPWDLVIDLAVAVVQAGVVIWIFMQFSQTELPIRLGLGVGVSLLLTLLLLAVADVATRRVAPPAPRPGPSFGFYER